MAFTRSRSGPTIALPSRRATIVGYSIVLIDDHLDYLLAARIDLNANGGHVEGEYRSAVFLDGPELPRTAVR